MLAIELLIQTGVYIINPNLANYLITLGASVALAGFVVGLNYATALVLRTINGLVCDLFSKKSLLIGSCVAFIVASAGIALSTNVETVALFRIIQGMAYVLKSSIVVSMASLLVPPDQRGSGTGIMGLGFTIACSLGPAIGNYLGTTYSYRASFLLAIVFFGAALFVLIGVRPPQSSLGKLHGSTDSIGKAILKELKAISPSTLFHIPSIPLALGMFITFMAQASMLSMLLAFANLSGVQGASWYYIIYAAGALLSKPLCGKLLDRFGFSKVLVPTSTLAAAAMILLAIRFTTTTIIIAAILMSFGQGAAYSAFQGEAMRRAPAHMVGRAANTLYAGSDMAQFVTPFIYGLIFQSFGIRACFITACITCIIGPIVYFTTEKALNGTRGE